MLVAVGDKDELFDIDKVKALYDEVPENKKEFLVLNDTTHACLPNESWQKLVSGLTKNVWSNF